MRSLSDPSGGGGLKALCTHRRSQAPGVASPGAISFVNAGRWWLLGVLLRSLGAYGRLRLLGDLSEASWGSLGLLVWQFVIRSKFLRE